MIVATKPTTVQSERVRYSGGETRSPAQGQARQCLLLGEGAGARQLASCFRALPKTLPRKRGLTPAGGAFVLHGCGPQRMMSVEVGEGPVNGALGIAGLAEERSP